MVKIYKQPFAHDGDAIAIPDTSQPDGKMSSVDGWTPDYQLPKADPNYKPVGRQEMNGVFKEVTEALGQVQVQGSAAWSADGAPYPVNAQVYHNGKQWIALRANSVAPTEGADWSAIGTAATANLTTSNLDGTTGRVLKVGDGGWMGQGVTQATPYGYPASVLDVTNQTKVIRSGDIDNGVSNFATGIHFAVEDTWGRLRVSHDTPNAWIQGGNISSVTGWTSQAVLSANMLQATGSSTDFPMSQKAVTNAINNSSLGVGQTWQDVKSERENRVSYTNTTGRPIQVLVTISNGANAGGSFSFYVDEVIIAKDLSNSHSWTDNISAVIPPGSTYKIDYTLVAPGEIRAWVELR